MADYLRKIAIVPSMLLLCMGLASCGSDDDPTEEEVEEKTEITAQYLYSLIGTNYDELKTLNIGEIQEEGEVVFSEADENDYYFHGIYTNIVAEGYNMSARYVLFNNILGEVDLTAYFNSEAEAIEAFKSLTIKANYYWGNPGVEYYANDIGSVINISSVERFWQFQYDEETMHYINMYFDGNAISYSFVPMAPNGKNGYQPMVKIKLGECLAN